MSAAFKKGRNLQIYVASRAGYRQRSTGTPDAAVARKMARMCQELRDTQEWELLDRVLAGSLTLRDLYAAYAANQLPDLRVRLRAVNLVQQIPAWETWVRADRGDTGTAELYRFQVERLTGRDLFTVADLTPARVQAWLASLTVSTGTRRKNLYALKSFIRFLVDRGVLELDPIANVRAPKKNPPRLRWETEDNDWRIVQASPPHLRALFAFIKATGAEVSAALVTQRRDLDLERGVAHVRGSKNDRRNRHEVIIEPWALRTLREHCRSLGFTPNALLWPGVTRMMTHYHHDQACKAVGIEDYTLRDARHSWAVRCRKRGGSLESIAEQLGHKGILMAATVYAVFKPTLEERREETTATATTTAQGFAALGHTRRGA